MRDGSAATAGSLLGKPGADRQEEEGRNRDVIMDYYCEQDFIIGTRDVDEHNHCRPSALLAHLQEAATAASVALKISREDMLARYNVFWMLARIWFRLERPLHWDDVLTVRTWHRGGRGVSLYRDFDLSVDGAPVGEAVSNWVLANQDTRKMLRASQVELDGFRHTGGSLCKGITLNKLRKPEEMDTAGQRLLHYSDTDINGHVNNARYADFALDALYPQALTEGGFLREMQVGYLAECHPGEVLTLQRGQEEGRHFVRGVGQDGGARFDAAVMIAPFANEKQRCR